MLLTVDVRPHLALRPSAALIAYTRLLEAPPAEVERMIEAELRENPALERVDPIPGTVAARGPAEPADQPGTLAQLALDARVSLPARDHAALALILGSLDDHGFLTVEPAAIARAAHSPLARVQAVLELVRELGPAGIGCRDLRGCLDAQLARLAPTPLVALARRIVADGLQDLADARYGALARRLGTDRDDVLAARDLIRTRLRPFPVFDAPLHGRGVEPGPVADVVITLQDGVPLVELPEQGRCTLRVSPAYDGADARRAQAFMRRLGERWSTLRRVAEALATEQRAFLLDGALALVPLTRAQLAARLNLHESTVSRAVAGRTALLPCGRMVELRVFFTASLSAQEALRQLVARERTPLSDDELAVQLGASGHTVARRTVAKYRGLLGIPPSAQRTGEAHFGPGTAPAKSASAMPAAFG
jgi:RNA polymerase sigma-54 factor